jgi:hypothetical protein
MPVGDVQCTSQDLFRLFMLFAISGVTRYRAGLSKEHPFGYYRAALTHIGSIPLIGCPDSIQNSLLIGRFGMYHHIGQSLWDISHFCMRQCIELGYHAPPQRALPAIEEQKQRRIFWECYILDRYSSGILGRPFAIADEDISAELPILADDEALKAANINSLSEISDIAPSQPTEVSVFVFYIKLRQVSSRIHTEFSSGRRQSSRSANSTPMPPTSAGYVHMKVHTFLDQLDSWRQSAPVFSNPKSLYERPEWYDFLLEKDKSILIRGAMHMAPKLSNNAPPSDLLVLSLRSATRVILLYSDMLEKKYITWTRSYFQGIFAAGLSILFYLSMKSDAAQDTSLDVEVSPAAALQTCSQVLHTFEKEMPDVRSFAVVFDELKDLSMRNMQQTHGKTSQFAHVSVPADQAMTGNSHVSETTDWSISHNRTQSQADTMTWDSQAIDGANWETSNLGEFSMGEDGLGWPLLTEEFMENLEAGLGEYAWGFAGDDHCYWQPDSL